MDTGRILRDGDSGGHGGDDGHGHGHVDGFQNKVYTTSIVILALLVIMSILFTRACDFTLEVVRPGFKPVVQAGFTELMVLGFVVLFLQVSMNADAVEGLSKDIFDDSHEIEHLSHQLHLVLFIVMIVYLIQLGILVAGSEIRYRRLQALEADCYDVLNVQDDYAKSCLTWDTSSVSGDDKRREMARSGKKSRRKAKLLSTWSRAYSRLQYASIRHAFITPKVDDEACNLEATPHFDFSEYLLITSSHETKKLVELSLSTWLSVLVMLLLGWVYLVAWDPPVLHHNVLIAFELCLTCSVIFIWIGMHRLKAKVTPNLFFDQAAKECDKCLSQVITDAVEDQKLSRSNDRTPYLSQKTGLAYALDGPSHDDNGQNMSVEEHEALFWCHRPWFSLWIVRLILFLQAVSVSTAWFIIESHSRKKDLNPSSVFGLVVVCISMPIVSAAYFVTGIIENYAIVTSVDPVKNPTAIAQVVRHQKLLKSFRSIQLAAILLAPHAKGSGEEDVSIEKVGRCCLEDDQALVAQLTPRQYMHYLELFSVFEGHRNGEVTREEIRAFLRNVSFAISPTSSFIVRDSDKMVSSAFGLVQTITFASFAAWIIRHKDIARAKEVHDLMFQLLDEDQNGFISLAELVKMMNAIGHDFHIDELMAALIEFDDSADGRLDRKEFGRICKHVGM